MELMTCLQREGTDSSSRKEIKKSGQKVPLKLMKISNKIWYLMIIRRKTMKKKIITENEYQVKREIRLEKALFILGLSVSMQLISSLLMLLINIVR